MFLLEQKVDALEKILTDKDVQIRQLLFLQEAPYEFNQGDTVGQYRITNRKLVPNKIRAHDLLIITGALVLAALYKLRRDQVIRKTNEYLEQHDRFIKTYDIEHVRSGKKQIISETELMRS